VLLQLVILTASAVTLLLTASVVSLSLQAYHLHLLSVLSVSAGSSTCTLWQMLSRNTPVHHRHTLLNCVGNQKDCWHADASALVREQKAITPQPSDFRPSNSQGPSQDKRQDRSRFFMEKGWDGFEKPGIEVKPGDWVCAECSQHNFARNTDCFKCGASKM